MLSLLTNLGIKPIHWNRLLTETQSQKLVPILGPELLTTEIDGRPVPFYHHIANEVVKNLEIEVPSNIEVKSISDVAYLYRMQRGDILDVYYIAYEVIQSRNWKIPDSLLKLAEIAPLDLLVTTTPDNLMVDALNQVRFGGEAKTRVLSFSPQTELQDLPNAYEGRDENVPTVFKFFGDVEMKPDYAITEEDVLKYIHHLQIKDQQPENLFDAFRSRSLMLLGCNFENWLIRFFLCTAKSEALFGAQGARGVIANQSSREDEPLLPFLKRNRTLLYQNGDGIDFIDELHRRYQAVAPAASPPAKASVQNPATAGISPGADPRKPSPQPQRSTSQQDPVFISYAREDGEAAERIRQALEKAGISVWMDQTRVEGGDVFELQMQEQIRACVVFLPIISKNTISPERRYYRMEWNLAVEEAKKLPPTYPFIQPVAIDETLPEAPHIPIEFTRRHWSRFPDGEVSLEFPKKLIRMLQRHKQRGTLGW